MPPRFPRRLAIAGSALLALTACQLNSPVSTAAAAPGLATVRGIVDGPEGYGVRQAIVRLGDRTTLTADPDESRLLSAPDAPYTGSGYPSVMHDFGDGYGPRPAERRPRRAAPGEAPFWFLSRGEFVFEDVAPGEQIATASICDQTTAPLSLRLAAGQTLEGVRFKVDHPWLLVEDGDVHHLAEITEILPSTDLYLSFDYERYAAGTGPAPHDLTIGLRAFQASGAVDVRGLSISLLRKSDGRSQPEGPYRLALPPRSLGAASDSCPGPVTRVTVPLSPAWFTKPYGSTELTIEFLGVDGYSLQGRNLETLQAKVTLR